MTTNELRPLQANSDELDQLAKAGDVASLILAEAAASGREVSPYARARAQSADQLVREGQKLIDAPIEASNNGAASAEVTRAKNRAEYRWRRAVALAREAYGESVKVDASIKAVVVTLAGGADLAVPRDDAPADVAVGRPGPQPSAYDADLAG